MSKLKTLIALVIQHFSGIPVTPLEVFKSYRAAIKEDPKVNLCEECASRGKFVKTNGAELCIHCGPSGVESMLEKLARSLSQEKNMLEMLKCSLQEAESDSDKHELRKEILRQEEHVRAIVGAPDFMEGFERRCGRRFTFFAFECECCWKGFPSKFPEAFGYGGEKKSIRFTEPPTGTSEVDDDNLSMCRYGDAYSKINDILDLISEWNDKLLEEVVSVELSDEEAEILKRNIPHPSILLNLIFYAIRMRFYQEPGNEVDEVQRRSIVNLLARFLMVL